MDNSVEKNIKLLAEAKNVKPQNLTACVLQRERHKKIIDELNRLNVKIKFISDGDVSGVIYVIDKESPVDIYIGIGGGPEGVLAAAALSCLGGQMQTRLILENDEVDRAKKMGINNHKKKYNIDDMVKGDVMFCASGVTDGDLVKGIVNNKNFYEASTYALHKNSKTEFKITNTHKK